MFFFFQLFNIERIGHNTETLLEQIRSNEIPVTADIIDILLRARDTMSNMLFQADFGNTLNVDDLVAELKHAQSGNSDKVQTVPAKELPTMRTNLSSEYAVQDVAASNLEKNKARSLIYSGGARNNGEREGDTIGVLGILFDWDTEAKKILQTCLPKDQQGMIIKGSVAIYTTGVTFSMSVRNFLLNRKRTEHTLRSP